MKTVVIPVMPPENKPPSVTADQMAEVDRLMVEEYGIELKQMMENAGRNLARLAVYRFLSGNPDGKMILVLAGSGGNGGGALVAARHLRNWGAAVSAITSHSEEQLQPVPGNQLAILRRMGIPVLSVPDGITKAYEIRPDLILDGIIGYSLKGSPTGNAADLIRLARETEAAVLSLDVPSGLDASTGFVHDPVIRATATLTLALPKTGLTRKGSSEWTGELYLADIGVPPQLYAHPHLALVVPPLFGISEIIRLR